MASENGENGIGGPSTVTIPPCKTPPDKALNPESRQATVSEEMEVLSPELQRVAKATLAPAPVVASDQPSRPNARTSPVLLPLCQFQRQHLLRPLLANPGCHLPNPDRRVPFLLVFFLLINCLHPPHSISICSPWRMKLHLDEFWIRFWVLTFPYL